MGNPACRFCNEDYKWSTTFICNKCEDVLKEKIYAAILHHIVPLSSGFWMLVFREYRQDEIVGALHRLWDKDKIRLDKDRLWEIVK